MRIQTMTTRLSALTLAVAAVAYAPHSAIAQDAAPASTAAAPAPATAAPVLPGKPEPVGAEATSQATQIRAKAAEVRARQSEIRSAEATLRAATLSINSGGFVPGGELNLYRTTASDAPLVLVTRPIDDSAAAELKEDLTVMDKLVRDEVARAGGEDPQRPWGIKLTMVGRFAPMYVEGGGAVFSAAVNFPLAAAAGGSAQRDAQPREPDSKWIRAKRQITGQGLFEKLPGQPAPPPPFDQAKLDALLSTIFKTLPEATNFRHLAEGDSVFVTIVGTDDAGTPLRMTLKASKADIDAAAAGTIKPEEFAQRVAQRIG